MRNSLTKALLLAVALVPAIARAEQKLGYVDLQRALNEVDDGKAAKALLKKDFDDKQKHLDVKKAEFDKLQADLEKQAVVMSDTAKRDKAGELDRRARELQGLYMQLQKDLSDRERDATKGIFERMANIVREIAEADGFTMVLDKSAGVVYAPPSLDLTNELIRKYNARHPPAAGGAKKAPTRQGRGLRRPEEVRRGAVATFTLAELAAKVGGEVQGDAALLVDGVASLEDAGPSHVSFLANRKYRKAFEASRAGAVIVEPGEDVPAGRTVLRAAPAYLAFAKISTAFHPPRESLPEVAPEAVIHPSARVHPSAQVMPLATVGPRAEVGPRTIVFPGVQLGEDVRVGADCVLYANVAIRERCVIGDRVILQPGCVIGSDGFGYALDLKGEGHGPRHYKIPQAGIVVVEDDVEIGANSCVDRATLGITRIGRGAKIDNLVQIAHNVEVGPLSIVAAQVGISGSTKLGMGVVVWGQAGLVGHISVGDRATIAAQAGVGADIEAGGRVAGSPATPDVQWARNSAVFNRLTEMRRELRELRGEVARLKGEEKK